MLDVNYPSHCESSAMILSKSHHNESAKYDAMSPTRNIRVSANHTRKPSKDSTLSANTATAFCIRYPRDPSTTDTTPDWSTYPAPDSQTCIGPDVTQVHIDEARPFDTSDIAPDIALNDDHNEPIDVVIHPLTAPDTALIDDHREFMDEVIHPVIVVEREETCEVREFTDEVNHP